MKLDFSNLRGDIFGGLTAGIVALPLALALGEAAGAGPAAGLYGAIAVGLFASIFGGTATQISGPTGPMVVVFAGLYGSFTGRIDLIFTAVVLAGLFQILFGALRLGSYIRLVPYPVVSGFMSGIGVIIILLQILPLVGHEGLGSPVDSLLAAGGALSDPVVPALIISAVTLAVVFLWPAKLGKFMPAPLAALIIGTVVSLLLPTKAPILGDIPTGLPELHLPTFDMTQGQLSSVVQAAFILALLGAIDSLLTSLVADNITRTRHESNRELFGQGLGNMVAGLIGGVAGAGATMRTVVNVRAGGRTRLSGVMHSLLLLAVLLGLGPYAGVIPKAALASILIKVGFDIIDWTYLKRAHRGPRWDLALMVLVLVLTVFVDLMAAVGAGVVLAALAFVQQTAKIQLHAITNLKPEPVSADESQLVDDLGERLTMFEFTGPLSFGAAADLGHHVRESLGAETKALLLDFSRVAKLDTSAARAVETILCDARNSGKLAYVVAMSDDVSSVMAGLHADHCLDVQNRFKTRIEALKAITSKLHPKGPSEMSQAAIPA